MYLTNFWSNLLYVAVHVRYYNSKYFWLYMVDWYGGSSCFSIPRSFMEVIVNQCSKIFTSCPKHGLNKCLIALIFHVYGQVNIERVIEYRNIKVISFTLWQQKIFDWTSKFMSAYFSQFDDLGLIGSSLHRILIAFCDW